MLAVDLRAPGGFRDAARLAQHALDVLDLEPAEHFVSQIAKTSILTAHVGRDAWAAWAGLAGRGSSSNLVHRVAPANPQRSILRAEAFLAGSYGRRICLTA